MPPAISDADAGRAAVSYVDEGLERGGEREQRDGGRPDLAR